MLLFPFTTFYNLKTLKKISIDVIIKLFSNGTQLKGLALLLEKKLLIDMRKGLIM